MSDALAIAGHALREAVRRRVLLVVALATGLVGAWAVVGAAFRPAVEPRARTRAFALLAGSTAAVILALVSAGWLQRAAARTGAASRTRCWRRRAGRESVME